MELLIYRVDHDEMYRQTLILRDSVLKKPFGLSIDNQDLSLEQNNIFLGAIEDGRLVGTLNYYINESFVAQLCSFAVSPENQRSGIGKLLVTELLDELRVQKLAKCIVNARESALGFYKKLGFDINSGPFYNDELGMNFFSMEINLEEN